MTAPTLTRVAELDELAAMRTQVAEPKVCTPAATATAEPATATPTVVPPVATGQLLPHGEAWLVTIVGIAQAPGGTTRPIQGQFLQLNVTIVNQTNENAFPPFDQWLLTTDAGQSYEASQAASAEIIGGTWNFYVAPGLSEDRAIIFDVPTDIGTTFVLESRSEPTFRVSLSIEARG